MVSNEDPKLRPVLSGAGTATTPGDPTPEEEDQMMRRRRFIQAGIGVSLVLTVGGLSALSVTGGLRPISKMTPDREPPADGDELVLAAEQGTVISPNDIAVGSGMIMAYPRDPSSQVVKSGTVDNLILIARFDPANLSANTQPQAADGIVAYSGLCPHLGCTVSIWDAANGWFHCPCHHAEFDPRDDAKVVSGPSPRPLPALPLKLSGGSLLVAGSFLTPVGAG